MTEWFAGLLQYAWVIFIAYAMGRADGRQACARAALRILKEEKGGP